MIRFFCFFSIICIITYACDTSKGYGSIEGNVFYGSSFKKPDAGAIISLYRSNDTIPILTAQANVNGDYKFDQVESGKYYIIIKSRNFTPSSQSRLLTYFAYRDWLAQIDPTFPKDQVFEKHQLLFNVERTLYNADSIEKANDEYVATLPSSIHEITGYVMSRFSFGFTVDTVMIEKGKVARPVSRM